MSSEKQKQLIQKLHEYDVAGVRFYDAKKQLLQTGYTEDEIAVAVASAPFDGKLNEPKKPHSSHQSFHDNPEQTKAIARQLLLDDAEKQQRKAHLQALSAAIWGSRISPMSARSFVTLTDTLGIPLFRLLVIGLFIFAVLYGIMMITQLIDLDGLLLFAQIYALLIGLLITYKTITASIYTYRLRKMTPPDGRNHSFIRSFGPAIIGTAIVVFIYSLLLGF